MTADLPPAIICHVVKVHDADTIRCANGQIVRLAGVNARERDGSCNHRPCPRMRHAQAHPIAQRLMLGKSIRFRIVGRSGNRLVGENYAVRCALFRTGAAVPWTQWQRRYRLATCGRTGR